MAEKPTKPLTMDEVRVIRLQFAMHLNLGKKGHVYNYTCADHPALVKSKHSKNGRIESTQYWVGDVECKTLEDILVVLNAHYGFAGVAPTVERLVETQRDGGSSPSPGTNQEKP